MTDQGDRHFAANPELVEQYVLDRLDRTVREQFEDHLRECAECRKAVEVERGIAAGVRRLARDEMKRRLARRVVPLPPTRAVPWPRIAAVAALLAVVVGIGYFGDWFNWQGSETGIATGEIAEQRTPLTANESSGEAVKDEDRIQKTAPPVVAERERAGKMEAGPTLSSQVKEAEPAPAPAEKSRLEVADVQTKEDRPRKDVAAPPAVSGRAAEDRTFAAVQQQFWATGTISSELNKGAGAVQATEEGDGLRLEKKAKRDKGEPAAKEQAIVLTQRSPATLPPAQQALRQQLRTKTIQSLIEERTDTLRIILYPDSPIGRHELQNARAERIGEDSLVVTVEGQQIGFRLPAELRQTRKTK